MEISAKVMQKYRKKKRTALLNDAIEWFNRYIRQRDSEDGCFKCISCGEYKSTGQMNAGHFMSAGQHSAVRFNENNVHGQCIRCNKDLHGNLHLYQDNLIKKIGLEAVELIKSTCRNPGKWDRTELILIIETYKAKCK